MQRVEVDSPLFQTASNSCSLKKSDIHKNISYISSGQGVMCKILGLGVDDYVTILNFYQFVSEQLVRHTWMVFEIN